MVPLNPAKITSNLQKAIIKSSVKHTLETAQEVISREAEMATKTLQLAVTKDGLDRFNPQDLKSITKAITEFKTKGSVYDITKQLLTIGSQKGEPLTPKEITDFLEATSGLKPEEQQKVLKFIDGLKSQDKIEYNRDYILKTWDFDEFKEKYLAGLPDWHSHKKNGVSDEEIMKIFEQRRKREIELARYDSYKTAHETGPLNSSLYVSKDMQSLIQEGILKCDDPKTLGELIVKLKVGQNDMNIAYASQDLLDAYKLSGKNENFTQDLIRGFYPAEVKEIVATLKAKGKLSPENFRDYNWTLTETAHNDCIKGTSLSNQRRLVLKHLGLKDEIKLLPLEEHQDLYVGKNRGIKITRGNFERGNRK